MKTSKMLIISYMGDHVWLITSRQTEPELLPVSTCMPMSMHLYVTLEGTYSSSMLGWNIRFTKPMLGLLYGYWSGSSTWIFQRPPWKGAVRCQNRSCFHGALHILSSGPLNRT